MAGIKTYLDPQKLLDGLDRFEAWVARQPKWLRISLGVALCLGGFLWFFPVLGLWMLPIGLIVLAQDIPWLLRRRERIESWLRRALNHKKDKENSGSAPSG
ncbi:MAG: hypothetical protein AAF563_17945 [Pseudomonadota bacterium]